MIELRKETTEEFMGLYIDFWQFLYIPSELRVKKKEREFMIHTLALNAKGMNISSKEYVDEMVRRMNLKKSNEVYNYRSRLKRKGFVSEENGVLVIPQGLNVREIPQETIFQFKVLCGEPTFFKNQQPTRQIDKMSDLGRRRRAKSPKLPAYVEPEETPPSPTTDIPEFAASAEPTRVTLPPKPGSESVPKQDPLRAASEFAGNVQRHHEHNDMGSSEERREVEGQGFRQFQGKGFANDSRSRAEREWDERRLPPIPSVGDGTDDGNANASDPDGENPDVRRDASYGADHLGKGVNVGVRKNIIDLND